mgnify:CR=1 FL=1
MTGQGGQDGTPAAGRAGTGQVFRRRVFYIPGFDPFPPRRYRELYRSEAMLQVQVSGYELHVRAQPGSGGCGWSVAARIPEPELAPERPDGMTDAEVVVLTWSAIVRGSMRHGIVATYAQLLRTAWIYLSTGAFQRLVHLRRGPVLAALYPFAVLLGQAALALVFGALAAGLVGPWLGAGAALATALGAGWLVLAGFRRIDNRIFAYYLMHDFAFAARQRGAYPEPLETFIAGAADRIAAALSDPVDEVLVVGHSAGAHLAISALAGLLRDGRLAGAKPQVALLTLGQGVPMLTFLPRAERLRADLHDLAAAHDRVFWLDVTAPADGCCFALCDPVAVSGVAPAGGKGPLVLSAAFSQTLSPRRWRALRRRYWRLHFQYLCAFDRPGHYDYFRLTAGPVTLARRYRGKAASPGRRTAPRSRYRTRAGAAT